VSATKDDVPPNDWHSAGGGMQFFTRTDAPGCHGMSFYSATEAGPWASINLNSLTDDDVRGLIRILSARIAPAVAPEPDNGHRPAESGIVQ